MCSLEMSGLGRSDGGTFNEVRLEGIQRFSGAVKCVDFRSEGIFRAEDVECQQRLTIEGIGTMRSLQANIIDVEGVCQVKERLVCQLLKLEGYLRVGQTLKTKTAQLVGKFKFKETVEAEIVDLVFVEHSSFDVISATTVKIKRDLEGSYGRKQPSFFANLKQRLMIGHLIEGEEVEIDYCKVKQVYGDRIKIGPYCQIDEIEYKESLEIHPTAVVKSAKQL